MYFNVVVKDQFQDCIEQNLLVFTFFSIEEALEFAKKILYESKYHIEILQFENEQGE